MTDAELRDLANKHFRQTTISYPEWQKRVAAGRYTPKDGSGTEWGKAFAALSQINSVPVPPQPEGKVYRLVNYQSGNLSTEWRGVLGVGGNDRATIVTTDPYKGGYCAQLDLPASTASDRSEFGLLDPYDYTGAPAPPFQMYVHQWLGTAFKLPLNFDWAACGGWGLQIAQYWMNDIWGAPIGLQLGRPGSAIPRALNLIVMSGVSSFGGSQYSSGPGGNIPETAVIGTDQVPLGKWIEVLIHAYRTNQMDGIVESFWKVKGETTWRIGGKINGYPTMEWWQGESTPSGRPDSINPGSLSLKWGTYRGPSNIPLRTWHGLAVVATTEAAAKACFT